MSVEVLINISRREVETDVTTCIYRVVFPHPPGVRGYFL